MPSRRWILKSLISADDRDIRPLCKLREHSRSQTSSLPPSSHPPLCVAFIRTSREFHWLSEVTFVKEITVRKSPEKRQYKDSFSVRSGGYEFIGMDGPFATPFPMIWVQLQYSSQIVEIDTVSLEFSGKIMRFILHTVSPPPWNVPSPSPMLSHAYFEALRPLWYPNQHWERGNRHKCFKIFDEYCRLGYVAECRKTLKLSN